MTAYALITGSLWKNPEQRSSSKTGKLFTTCTVKVGSDATGASDFWNILSFSESSQLELLRLEIGDAVSVRGKLEIKTYTAADGTTKISRSIFADSVLGLRPAPREKKPKAAKAAPAAQETTTTTATDPDLDDSIPF
jgi:single-stranded DNA-binding protein